MDKLFAGLLFTISVILIPNFSVAQVSFIDATPSNGQKFDSKLLKYYSISELEYILSNAPDEYNKISYYHLSSYELIITDSTNTLLTVFDPENFDISKYENRRKLNETVMINLDKYGIQLIIIPYSELIYLTPAQIATMAELN